ncbi:hypothetical protein FOCC_FOCC006559 [Frankliniella occidentalis]|nr:hypothetical protein FOCC_FOCC006559 [Frankliniella occidentalis]
METDSDSTSASPSLATSTQSIDTSAETSPSEIFTEQSTSTATTVYSSIATQHQTKPTTVNTVGPISLSTEQQVTDNGNTETNSEESMSTTTSFYSSLATELRTKPSTETLVTESGSTPAALVTTNTNTPPFSFTPYFSTERSTSQTMTTQSGITDFSPLTDQTFISTERLTTYNGYTVPHLTSSVSDSSAWDTSTDAYIVSSAASQSFPEQLTTSAITYSTSLATELETESTMSAQSDTAALTTLTTINSSEDFTTDMSTKADRSSTTETLTPSTASSGVSPSGTRKADPSEYYECVEINNNQEEGPVRKTCPGTSVFSKETQRCVEAPVQPPTTTTLPEPDSNTEISTSRQTDISTTTKTFVTTQSTLTTASSFETPSQNRSVTTASMVTEPTTTTGKPASTTNTKNDSSSMTVSPSLRTSTHSFDISSAETIYSSMATKNQTEPTTITTSFSTEQLVTDNGNTETNSDSTTASPSLPTSTQSIDKSSAETSPSEIFTETSTTTTPTVYSSIATQHQTKPTTVNTMGPISLSTENLVTDDVTTETDSDSTNASPILPTSTQSIDTSAETSPPEIFTEQSTSTAATVYSSLATEHQTEATAVTRVGPITFSTEEQVTDSSNTETNSDSTTASPNLSISTQSIDTSSAETIPSEIFTEESTAITTTIYSSMATTLQTEPTTITTVGPTSFSTQQLVTDNASTNASPSLATSTQSINTSSAKTSPPEIFTEESTPPATTVYSSIATKQTETTTVTTVRPITFSTEQQVTDNGAREDFFTPNASVSDDLYIMPTNFRLGATSSAYQTEGAWDTDGKGPSIQDNFYHGSGGDSGDIACNSYAEYLVDVNLLRNMSFQTYHFSMSWSRLLPTGSSLHANQVAINFYDKLLSALIENHIEPVVTLHHWDIPSGIVNGWLNSSAPDYFLDYATFAFSLFGSRVSTWLLLHDPVTLCVQGYAEGQIGPGIVDSQGTAAYRCVHNQILAHAQAYRAYRRDFADWQQGSTDFLGLKHSSARLCTEGQRTAQISFSNDVNVATRLDEKWLRTPGGQDAITPWSIRGALNWIDERYNGVQVLVTENGYSGSADNDIDDVKRSAYFSAYLRGVMRAVNEDRCNVMGYAARSLTDSFEWNNGYNVKYGLAHVDFSSGSRPRLLKPAPASFFRNVLQNRAVDFVAFISP